MGVRVEGMSEVVAEVRALGKLGDPAIVIPALNASAEVLRAEWARRMRRKSGKTADSIHVFPAAENASGGTLAVKVGPSSARAHIARFLEDGYLRRNKRLDQISQIPAYPSQAPAFEAKSGEAEQVFEDELARRAGLR